MYHRVIPRDFFNEAKLLKCMGFLALKILDNNIPKGISIEIEESGDPFKVKLHIDGTLEVANYPVTINNRKVTFVSRYNSKASYPLMAIFQSDGHIEVDVFTEDGEFDEEFIIECRKL